MSRLRPVIASSVPVLGYRKSMARIVRLVLGALGLLLYTWFAAVRSLPRVRARKAARARDDAFGEAFRRRIDHLAVDRARAVRRREDAPRPLELLGATA